MAYEWTERPMEQSNQSKVDLGTYTDGEYGKRGF